MLNIRILKFTLKPITINLRLMVTKEMPAIHSTIRGMAPTIVHSPLITEIMTEVHSIALVCSRFVQYK